MIFDWCLLLSAMTTFFRFRARNYCEESFAGRSARRDLHPGLDYKQPKAPKNNEQLVFSFLAFRPRPLSKATCPEDQIHPLRFSIFEPKFVKKQVFSC